MRPVAAAAAVVAVDVGFMGLVVDLAAAAAGITALALEAVVPAAARRFAVARADLKLLFVIGFPAVAGPLLAAGPTCCGCRLFDCSRAFRTISGVRDLTIFFHFCTAGEADPVLPAAASPFDDVVPAAEGCGRFVPRRLGVKRWERVRGTSILGELRTDSERMSLKHFNEQFLPFFSPSPPPAFFSISSLNFLLVGVSSLCLKAQETIPDEEVEEVEPLEEVVEATEDGTAEATETGTDDVVGVEGSTCFSSFSFSSFSAQFNCI